MRRSLTLSHRIARHPVHAFAIRHRLRTWDAATGLRIEDFLRYTIDNRAKTRIYRRRFGRSRCNSLCGGGGNETNRQEHRQKSNSDDFLHVNLSLLQIDLLVEYGSVDILAGFGVYASARLTPGGWNLTGENKARVKGELKLEMALAAAG